MAAQTVEEKNKELVTAFYELAINQKRPTELAGKYIGLPYTQHNPEVPRNGPEGFIQFVDGMFKKHPDLKVTIHKVMADGDFVALHVHLKRNDSDPGMQSQSFSELGMERLLSTGTDAAGALKIRPAATRCFEKA